MCICILTLKRMRKIISVLFGTFILFLVVSWCAAGKTTSTLKVHLLNCRYDGPGFLSMLYVISKGDTIREIQPQGSFVTIEELLPDTYQLGYTSLFGLPMQQEVIADKPGTYPVEVCVDYLDYAKENYHPVIDRLRSGETYEIIFHSQGCFSSDRDTLTVTGGADGFIAHHGKQLPLDSTRLKFIRHFEFEMNHVDRDGCTTEEDYAILLNGHTMHRMTDGGCTWWGFGTLLKQLGFKED